LGLGLVTMGSGALDQPIIFITGAGLLVLASFSHKHR